MASNKVEIETSDRELKHLGFVRVIAMNSLFCLSHLYEFAEQNSGPLKSTVGTVESAVTTVLGPVYKKFKDVPDGVLVFVDKKVDDATEKFDEHAPRLAKQAVSKAQSMIQKASDLTQDLVREAQVGGLHAAINYACIVSKQSALSLSAKAWYVANKIPPFRAVAQMALPTAAYFSGKYNKLVADMVTKGYTIFSFIPLIPIEEITKAYKQVKTAKEGVATTGKEGEKAID